MVFHGALQRAVALIPDGARNDAGVGPEEVREWLRYQEWEMALDILQDFDGIGWQTVEYWDLLVDAARLIRPLDDGAWLAWRRAETLRGLIRVDLRLVPPDSGGRKAPVPGRGQLRPLWSIGVTTSDGRDDLHVARMWVEAAADIPPGGRGSVRLLPLTPAPWRRLAPGDAITMHEGLPPVGTATITEIQSPRSLER
ncbi:hypothetical protein Lfu02_77060 [Longispora fulva]|uniref:Uncharacterized protein n=1 Tax=Longispora fulva TaxID=619741 RepID=A0A8J7KK26_9ACTN|nr:hypothetical protein [Longispora fulva]MBG6136176.1 hypothetical protein [Longispora fulva]GIG63334.1 hypothetical protein Lfu02_77060 [Longispora fulva]